MWPSSDDAEPRSDLPGEPESSDFRDVNINAYAAPFSTQVVGGSGGVHQESHFYQGREWVPADEITDNQVAEYQHVFVTPPRYDHAWDTLNSKSVLVISAAAGTGKKTAAINLLAELRYPRPEHHDTARARLDLGLRELDDDWDKPRVSKLPLFPRQGLLLELSGNLEFAPEEQFGSQLVDYAQKLAALQSFLIILVTPDAWKACAGPASDLTEDQLGCPAARDLIEARLTHPSSPCPQRVRWLDDDFRDVLQHDLLPGDADVLYEAIVAAEDSAAGRANAIDQFHGWRSYLTDWWKDLHTDHGPYERAMQIVMATIGRAPAGDVLTLTDRFLNTAGHETHVHLPLSGPDLSERLRRVGAVAGEDGVMELEPNRPRFHGAVLDHVWRERVQVQDSYKKWIVQVTQRGHIGKRYVEQIAASVTGMGIRQKSVEFLELIETWVKNQADQDTLATRMLEDTCLDPVVGAQVRKQLRVWAEQRSTPDRLVNIVITVCQGELARQRTVVALTRLKKILLRPNAEVFTAAVSTAIAAIARHADHLHEVLSEVVEWMKDADATPGRTGFLALMASGAGMTLDGDSPVMLLLDECRHHSDTRSILTDAWHTVIYANPGDSEVVSSIRNLLGFANKNRTFVDVTVGILGPAIQGDLKKTIAGKVLLNTPIDDGQDDADTAHAKLLDVLFDETRHATPAPTDPPLGAVPVASVMQGAATTEPTDGRADTIGVPQEVDSSPVTVAQMEHTEIADNDSAWTGRDDTMTAYQPTESPAPSTSVYPDAPAALPPDDDHGERRGWFRR